MEPYVADEKVLFLIGGWFLFSDQDSFILFKNLVLVRQQILSSLLIAITI